MSKSPAQIAVEALDEVARAMELKWGVDRLPRLVAAFDADLVTRFWAQLEKLNAACETGYLEGQEREAGRMRNAWMRLDREAEAAGCSPLDPHYMEARLPDGRLLVVCGDLQGQHRLANDNRAAVVWSMQEIASVLWRFEMVNDAKLVWPGAVVEQARIDPERVKPKVDWSKGDPMPMEMSPMMSG